MAFLSISNLTKQYEDHRAVDDLSFSVDEGQFIALLGPSGCGKSTTLMMLAGLAEPSSGQISIKGEDITHSEPGARNLSMVFQSYALFPHLSVKENILFGLKARKVDRKEQASRLSNVLDLVDLHPHLMKKPGQLSGGQCQRVALARAIVSQAPICLMDEPLSNLDAKLRNEMRTEIRALQQRLGLTVIYVTHDQVEAMSMADRVILLNKGQIEQNGRPETLYNQPASHFVASFIGHPPMNLIPRDHFTLGIRPEHIRLCDPSNQLGLPVRFKNCDYHGATTLVSVQYQEQTIKFTMQGHHNFDPEKPLRIQWDAKHEHSFDGQTGRRLTTPLLQHHLNEGRSQ